MHEFLLEWLECPVCHAPLEWSIGTRAGEHLESAAARCTACAATYPVREGIGVFLPPNQVRGDPWQAGEGRLSAYLRLNPGVEQQLMAPPLETLRPADQFCRAQVLEERGDYLAAREAVAQAWRGLYLPGYLAASNDQMRFVVQALAQERAVAPGLVVDLVCGRGALLERMAAALERPIVATDYSPRGLLHTRGYLQAAGLAERVSLLACDARRTPFKRGAVAALTTYLGLPSIPEPDALLRELRRVVGGMVLAIALFYPEDDRENRPVIKKAGMTHLLFREPALRHFADTGWQVEMLNVCRERALPTPRGHIIKGANIDALPVAETLLEWCVLRAY